MKKKLIQNSIGILKRYESNFIISLILIAGLVCSLYLLTFQYFIGVDGVHNIVSGRNLVTGFGFTNYKGYPELWYPPLYPLSIGIVYIFIGNIDLSAHLASIMFFLSSIILIFKLAEMVYNKRIAYICTLLFTFHKLILSFSNRALSHSMDVFLKIAVLYTAILIVTSEKLRYKYFIILGILISLAILTRAENIIVAITLIIVLAILLKERLSKKILPLICLLCVSGILLSPYVHFLHRYTGRWMLTRRIRIIRFYRYLSSNEPYAREKHFTISKQKKSRNNTGKGFNLIRYVKKNFRELINRYRKGILLFGRRLWALLYAEIGFILILLGLFGKKWGKDRVKTELILLCGIFYLIILPFGNCQERYYLSALPIFFLWVGKGIHDVPDYLPDQLRQIKRLRPFIISIILCVLIFPTLIYLVKLKPVLNLNKKYMGLWMRNNIDDIYGKKIACMHLSLAYYSGAQYVYGIPFFKKCENLIACCKENENEYLIIDTYIAEKYPHLKFLLNDKQKHDNLVWIHTIENPGKIVLYKIK